MTLESWRESGFLLDHQPSRQEVADLFEIVRIDLKDACIAELSPDRRLACCYNAILTSSRAALRASGFRASKGPNHHYYAIQSLQFTAALDPETIRRIEAMGKKRVVADYVRIGEVSNSMVEEALAFAEACCRRIEDWIRRHHPDLVIG